MKKIKYLLIGFVCFMFCDYVYASSVSISSSSTSVTTGTAVTVTATVSSDTPVVSIEGTLMCKGAGVSSGTDMNFDDSSNSVYSKKYSITVKPSSAGTMVCSVTGARLTNMSSDSWQNLGDKSVNVTVKAPAVVAPRTYSSNNYLKDLGIEGFTLTPGFSKDTLEYSVEVPNDTKTITITALKDDSSASVSGTGEKEVSEGTNKFEIKVTAENGNVKTYIINVTVKELDPISVKIGKDEYTIIRKEGVLDAPDNYEKDTVKINNEDVLCYKNKITNNILIGLKDKDGNSAYYTYDAKKNTYTKYNGYKIGGLYLSILDMPSDKLPSGYSKVSFMYNNNKLDGYQNIDRYVTYAADENVKGSSFYLVYALNEITGKESLYVYDKDENTMQRYNADMVSSSESKADKYFLYMLISFVITAIALLSLVIVLVKKKKSKVKFA